MIEERKIKEFDESLRNLKKENFLKKSNFPQNIINLILSRRIIKNRVILDLNKYIKEKDIIILSGEYGTGKTVAACFVLTDIYCAGFFITARQYLDCYFDNKYNVLNAHQYSRVRNTTNLIVDELGVDHDGQIRYVENLVCERYGCGDKTILTTNLSKKEFIRQYSGKLVSRINHVGAWIECVDNVRPNNMVLR